MEQKLWEKVDELFHIAQGLKPEEQTVFLHQVCANNEALRAELCTLLAEANQDDDFLNTPLLSTGLTLLAEEKCVHREQEIGFYRILNLLGQGGMGEVYLAEDTRLPRLVAVKLLPKSVTEDPDSVARFKREAYAASAITHPNVAHIYDLGVVKGQHYLVMEYVKGETLRQLLQQQRLPALQSLDIALQIADALNAAHQTGVIHRDIKPENIMVGPDGYIKVLDFGLAKITQAESERNHSKPIENSFSDTKPGFILGTTPYMSPEQVRGQVLAARADLWSLGVVLYEMLTGRKPFEGETNSDITAAILLKEPPPLPKDRSIPKDARKILLKALAKNPAARYQTANEMKFDLSRLKDQLYFRGQNQRQAIASTAAKQDAKGALIPAWIEVVKSKIIFWGRYKVSMLVLLASLLVGVVAYKLFSPSPGPIWRAIQLTNSGKAVQAAISPDGKQVAYVLEMASKQGLYIRNADSISDVTTLVPPSELEFMGVAFSPDGQSIFYSAKKSEEVIASLYQVPIHGGTSRFLLTDIDSGPSFSPNGKEFVFLRQALEGGQEGVWIADTDGSNVRELYTRSRPEFIPLDSQPIWSPDGEYVVCTAGVNEASAKKVRLLGVHVKDRKTFFITKTDWVDIAQTAWLTKGSTIYMVARENTKQENRQLYAVSYPKGKVQQITHDNNDYYGISISQDGHAFTTLAGTRQAKLYIVNLKDAPSQIYQLTTGGDDGFGVAWLNDREIVFGSNATGNPDLWKINRNQNIRTQLTKVAQADIDPAISPDGKFIVFTSNRTGAKHVWRMNINGENQQQLTFGTGEATPVVTRDGKSVLFYTAGAGISQLQQIPLQGGTAEVLREGVPRFPAQSPNGEWLAFAYRPPGGTVNKIGVVRFAQPSAVPQVFDPVAGARSPGPIKWMGDSGFAYIVTREGISNLWSQSLKGGPARPLTAFQEHEIYAFDFAPDGKEVVCARGEEHRHVVLFRH
ncbi:MAG TPA: protein kinase [Blastocatellia bacterium]|nr:protein kinase [Blastocatellia bacterium]